MKREVRWSDRPEPRRHVPIVTVRVGCPLTVCVAGPLLGVYAHYLDGSSVPCQPSDAMSQCPLCKNQKPRWKGFLPCQLPSEARRIVEITEGCYHSLSAQRIALSMGTWLRFHRKGPSPNSPLLVVQDLVRGQPGRLSSFDARESVEHMWGLNKADSCPDGVDEGG